MNSSRFLQLVVEAESQDTRLNFVRAAVFQLYCACLSIGSAPAQFSVEFSLSEEEAVTFVVRPFVNKIEALGGLVKSLFSANAATILRALPCRVEDKIGSGIGLILFVDDEPMITIGSLADNNGLFLRQIESATKNAYGVATIGTEVGKRLASVVPIPTGSLHLRKPK
ncbi:hypothetical protein B5K11_25720 [Rhizobium leguminosarum bv. trifolii]|uniref:hypothetical protein n=1 Tax=Rhizobium leguminosarum TaxID=384 RepID=UPI000E2ECC16|nr:hypothetical protein [Rhizobium leguminosarum]RFB88844.1 hypothetical protein B5K11_25720 [Rhizobium leguminosarum bv. trifolii]